MVTDKIAHPGQPDKKLSLLGLTREELESFAVAQGQPAFRGRQLYNWLYAKRVCSLAAMSDLPAEFRVQLAAVAECRLLPVVRRVESPDRAVKFLFALDDGLRVESVYLPHSPGETVCISSQVGCALGCHFCATAKMGLFRNLTAAEIVAQVLTVEQLCATRLTNVVYMGMGEPLHNYDEVVKSLRLLTDHDGIAITASRITVSTVGIVPAIDRWCAELPPAKLAVSLHATTDERRSAMMPVNKAYPLELLTKSLRRLAHVTRHPVTFEYIMIAGENDRSEDVDNLKYLLRNIPAKVNLIRLHPTGGDLQPTTDENIDRFMGWLTATGIRCTLRESRGVSAQAACGMLYSDEPFKPTKARAWERPAQ
jgi:23S rRNA (adenine2503-C2)-methyltransferase